MDAIAPTLADPRAAVAAAFGQALARFGRDAPTWLLGHNDADGLASLALLARALGAAGWATRIRIVGRGESAWDEAMRAELASLPAGGVIVADLGVRPVLPKPGAPTLVIDHHVPGAAPAGAEVISGFGMDPIPTTSLLAYWCAGAVADPEPWLWLAAVGAIGDMADESGFPELAAARRYGVTALRETAALVNAPRRTACGDASLALRLLLAADGPREIAKGGSPDAARLRAARAEVAAALAAAKRVPPTIRDRVALIRFASPAQVHPLVAQQWRGRLHGKIVLAANTGYRPGWVHFAARAAADVDLVAFLRERRPPGAGDEYGGGHRAATGGALRIPDWNFFVRALGFGAEAEISAP